MDGIHKKIVRITLTRITIEGEKEEELDCEFCYKGAVTEFYKDVEVKLTNLHDILFSCVKIGFYKHVNNKKIAVGASKIYFKEFYSDSRPRTHVHDILDHIEIEKANYYNAEWNKIGTLNVRYTVEDRPDLLDEKQPETFVQNVFNLCMAPHKTEVFFKIFDLLTDVRKGSFLCNFWAVIGCLPADYYYSFLYGACNMLDCDGTNCKSEFCEKGYTTISPGDAKNAYYILQEAAAAFADGFSVKYLANIRTRSDIVNRKFRAILERINVNDGDVIEFSEGNDDICGYIIYFKRINSREKPDTIGISFRGTASGNDTLNDMQSTYTEFQDGYTHSGFKKLVDYFMNEKFTQIVKIAQKKNIRKIQITGYSLGAAVGVLLHLRILEKYNGLFLKTVVFACPPCVSENIAKRPNLNITVYAYDTDIITRLSYGAILDLKYFCISISSLLKLINIPGVLTTKIDEIRSHIKQKNRYPKLYHPGKLIHVKKFEDVYKFKLVHYRFFDEIIFCRNAGWDHFLHNIANAFIYCTMDEDIIIDATE